MKIEKYLLNKGIQPHLKGFDYLLDAIRLCQKDKTYLRAITTRLYPDVAKMNNDTASKTERAIRHAIIKSKILKTNGEFIATAVIELSEE